MPDASDIRDSVRQQRQSLTTAQQQAASMDAVDQLLASGLLDRVNHLACYFPFDGEIDLTDLMVQSITATTTFYFPVLKAGNKPGLWFVPWQDGDPLAANRYGIPEPEFGPDRLRPIWALDMILMPLTAFNSAGDRLGMGAGYYDRSFSFLNRRKKWFKPLLIGAAHDFQRVEAVEPGPWDVALDGVVTPSELILF